MRQLLKRSAVSIALISSLVALFPAPIRAQAISSATTIEVYPGPGVNTYQSHLYTVEVFDGSVWRPSYVYQYSRKSLTHWHQDESPSVSFTTFGTTGPVDVRVTKLSGPINTVDASPKSKRISGYLSGGQAIGTLNPNNKIWLTIDRDDANPLFIFADAPRPLVPPGATYFGPGIRDIAPAAGNHYKARNSEVIYLDGGAWVRGNIDVRGTRNVRIIGPGVLSGDLWSGENVGSSALPFAEFTNYAMITGDFAGNGASVNGITIVDSPGYNFFGGATHVYGVKILSPWFYSTDAFQAVSHVDQSFVFNGDNVFTPMWAGQQHDNVTYTSSFVATTLNSVFAGGYWGSPASNRYASLADDIDIRTYNSDDWGPPLLAAVFQIWMDNSDGNHGFANQTYQNIRIEGDYFSVPVLELKNMVYPWSGSVAPAPPLGNSYNLVFRNISVTGAQKYLSEIKGWDANNGFHNVVLDNVSFNGEVVTQTNLGRYFEVNRYVWGLAFTTPGAPCAAGATHLAAQEDNVVVQGPGRPPSRPRDVSFRCPN